MLFELEKRKFWALHFIALMAMIPLVLTLRVDLSSLLGMLSFGVLFVSSFILGRRTYRNSIATTKEDRAQGFVSDFEDRGLGWFWEIGREGELTYISKSISVSLGKTQKELLGLKFASILSERRESGKKREWMTLGFHLSSRTPFSDLPFKSTIDENRCWSISGSPVYDQLGNYQGFRGNGLDLSQMKESERVLNQLAKCDPLTGLANRLEINRCLEQSFEGPKELPSKCSLFLLDLDKFKPVNDTMGHPVGDQLLKIAAQVIVDTIGDNGQVGRIGGDEFQVVIPSVTDQDQLKLLANRVIQNLSKPHLIEEKQVTIGASIGVSIYEDEVKPTDTASLVRDADLALYEAKKSGGGVCRFYHPDMMKQAFEERELQKDLRQALVKEQLSLEYQPIINISDRTLRGFEAILCWNHPTRGWIDSTKILKMAEDINIVPQVGDWTVRTACAQLKSWNQELQMAITVSASQLTSGNLARTVVGALASTGIRPSQLELEISKGIFQAECSNNVSVFNQLKKTGVKLVFDNFGTGYSALGYLHQVRFDKLKIDQSFVRGAGNDGRMNSAIISSIVTLARALKIDTTADGVETPEELAFVQRLGCTQAQGTIFGEPLTSLDATKLLEASGIRLSAYSLQNDREERRSISHQAKLYDGHQWHDVLIKNISRYGAMLKGLGNIEKHAELQIDFGNRQIISAKVIWSKGNEMGVHFSETVDVSTLKLPLPIDFTIRKARAS
ncbi:MAG: hypothetical protein Pars2KO_00080 [Parasphingorhabdus sp.]